MKRSPLWLALCLLSTFSEITSGAEGIDNTGLPYWCDEKTRIAYGWKTTLQGGLYHYCGGLTHLNSYYKKTTPYSRSYALEKAIGEFNYMIVNNPGSRDPLLGEVYLNRAVALRLGNKEVDAMQDLQKSLELNPKLSQAYIELATIFTKLKQEKKALQVVSEGLRHLPENKNLQRRYHSLGGKLPYPAPFNQPADEVKPLRDERIEPQSVKSEATTTREEKPSAAPATQQEQTEPKGNKTNPWCRFCP